MFYDLLVAAKLFENCQNAQSFSRTAPLIPTFLVRTTPRKASRLSLPVDMDGGEFWGYKQQNFNKGMISS